MLNKVSETVHEFKSLGKEVAGAVNYRLKAPLLGSYVIIFFSFHYTISLALISSQSSIQKIETINSYVNTFGGVKTVLFPLLLAAMWALVASLGEVVFRMLENFKEGALSLIDRLMAPIDSDQKMASRMKRIIRNNGLAKEKTHEHINRIISLNLTESRMSKLLENFDRHSNKLRYYAPEDVGIELYGEITDQIYELDSDLKTVKKELSELLLFLTVKQEESESLFKPKKLT
ncbi:hypothetical protein HBN50_07890 [Halobacteriovorax sp. GB3]|uniref:hypothetical protein n=1 Tax=Halobacteriovorax sp. GB3 TaxID=2719615 RepID=UPI00235DC7E9|nr:hypothetical protein [Halobacteriovorax sp. GB3]MDD0853013.1 hypothetical protein [Halobacteriovorax sp. GB3]